MKSVMTHQNNNTETFDTIHNRLLMSAQEHMKKNNNMQIIIEMQGNMIHNQKEMINAYKIIIRDLRVHVAGLEKRI
jgi:hypothetical protein